MELLVDEIIDGHKVTFDTKGTFTIDGSVREWYKDAKTQKTWIPKKTGSLRGLIKQIIKEDY